jgi:hypothetical protein
MGLNVCPAAIVAAPVEKIWALLTDSQCLGAWADVEIDHVDPPGPVIPGQMIYLISKEFGYKWHLTFKIAMIDHEKHQLHMHVTLPLGMHLEEYLSCTPIDATSCRVQYG